MIIKFLQIILLLSVSIISVSFPKKKPTNYIRLQSDYKFLYDNNKIKVEQLNN